ncbi:MAG: UTRA domain-containing protein [Gemmobacter sp.]|nr:UTRA domain-containing protein [Gemmobacter sp.]
MTTTTWQWVEAEALRRIRARDWAPGDRIPDEADLAQEFGCSRATVNRALQELAHAGWLERKRKAGTRVALIPVRKATFEIAIIRRDIESQGKRPGYRLLHKTTLLPPAAIRDSLRLDDGTELIHLTALHLADEAPFCLEDRWLNPTTPGLDQADFERVSANEWLVQNAAFSGGGIEFFALPANVEVAQWFACPLGEALFAVERTTWAGATPITAVRLTYAPGYRMITTI